VRSLTEHDFYGSDPSAVDRIQIIAAVTGFEPDDPERHTDWFRWGRGTIGWLHQETGAIKAVRDDLLDELTCRIAFAARFDKETLEVVTARYFYDSDLDPFAEDINVTSVPFELIRQVGFFLVPASRTWDRTISFGSELFRRVVSYVGGRPAAAVLAERDRLRAPNQPLDEDANLRDLAAEINRDVETILGHSSPLRLRITATDSESILDSVFPHFEVAGHLPLPSRRHGSGLVSLQTLILLMRFGQLRVAHGDSFMMVIEEPELHVPPPLQRKLLRMMQTLTTQTIVTTHSPTVAAIPEPHELFLIVNQGGILTTRALSKKRLTPDTTSPIRSLLLSDRDATVYALMHSALLIPEGKTDASWLRLLVKCFELSHAVDGAPGLSFVHEVGTIPTKDARVREVFEHLRSIHPLLVCLFDGDSEGDRYTADVCRCNPPPRIIIRWSDGRRMEDMVGWIIEAAPEVLRSHELIEADIPTNIPDLITALQGRLKTDDIVHAMIAEAILSNANCVRRVGHILQVIADLAMGRNPMTSAATEALHPNGETTIWTFSHGFHGI
jgi:hypothetical protein